MKFDIMIFLTNGAFSRTLLHPIQRCVLGLIDVHAVAARLHHLALAYVNIKGILKGQRAKTK